MPEVNMPGSTDGGTGRDRPGLGRRLLAMFAIYRGLPAPVYILFLATVINGIGIFVFPFMTLFLTKNLGMSEADAERVVLAYEPIWAIGTGRTATSEQANDTIAVIRAEVRRMFGAAADKMRIQYGGSMKPQNAKELMAMSEIDGGLIGGASLKANDFAAIVHYDK